MINYFKDKTSNDFKNSKKYWQFYSSSIKLKSDCTENSSINITQNNETFSDPEVVSNLFNVHFTSLASESNTVRSDCSNFIEKLFP